MEQVITYCRVSKPSQGESGLSLEAQQDRVHRYAASNNMTIIREFVEVESGLNGDRPLVNELIALSKSLGARILIASQCRLARSVLFFALLMESKIPFTNVDSPNDPELVIYIKAAIDQDECRRISERTKAALAAAKRRGVILGASCHELHKKTRLEIEAFVMKMIPIILELEFLGFTTVRSVMEELNRRGIPTFRGRRWHITTVYNLLLRIKEMDNRHEVGIQSHDQITCQEVAPSAA